MALSTVDSSLTLERQETVAGFLMGSKCPSPHGSEDGDLLPMPRNGHWHYARGRYHELSSLLRTPVRAAAVAVKNGLRLPRTASAGFGRISEEETDVISN